MYQGVAAALDENFHTHDAGVAQLIDARLATVQQAIANPPIPFECAAPSDPACKSSGAYYRRKENVIRRCPETYFALDANMQTHVLIHEAANASLVRRLEPGDTTQVADFGSTQNPSTRDCDRRRR